MKIHTYTHTPQKMYSGPLNNNGLNCAQPLTCDLFVINTVRVSCLYYFPLSFLQLTLL